MRDQYEGLKVVSDDDTINHTHLPQTVLMAFYLQMTESYGLNTHDCLCRVMDCGRGAEDPIGAHKDEPKTVYRKIAEKL